MYFRLFEQLNFGYFQTNSMLEYVLLPELDFEDVIKVFAFYKACKASLLPFEYGL